VRLAIIPARGGSRRVPSKNYRPFRGQPMLLYPIQAAQASGLFDLIVVSTDHHLIADIAFQAGCAVLPRPTDDGSTGTQEIAARVLDQLQVHGGAACVIYPTSPLLHPGNLQEGWARLLSPAALNKSYAMSVGPDGQDAGCFYWGWTLHFRGRRPLDAFTTLDVPLPAERVCDINTPEDWARAESMFDALRRATP
jgi:pseudaminic acid cytidylyltransferase